MPNKGSILAVDDTEASLKVLTDLLKEAGYSVRSAISGELALRSAGNAGCSGHLLQRTDRD